MSSNAITFGIFVAILSLIDSELSFVAFILGIIIIPIVDIQKEKKEDIAKFGWSARHEKWGNVPPERKAIVEQNRIDRRLAENKSLQQRVRESNESLAEKRAMIEPDSLINTLSSGFDNTRPSLKTFEKKAAELPSQLGEKLMNAAVRESDSSAKAEIHFTKESKTAAFKEQMDSIENLKNVIKEVNTYKSQQKANQAIASYNNREVGKAALPTDDFLD